jgi:NADH-quinone oxidoreductase subunit G
MAKVTIDDITIDVPDGTSILAAARMIDEQHGTNIAPPTMCYYSKLKTTGGYCRTCIVNVVQGSEKDPRPIAKACAKLQNKRDGRYGSTQYHFARITGSACRCSRVFY